MSERVLRYTATIPAGTPIATPLTVPFPLDGFLIERIHLSVPPGPAGTMGFILANNGRPWVPRNTGEWLIWDDHQETIVPTGYPAASGWEIIGYNLGQYQHTVNVAFHVSPVPGPSLPAAGPEAFVLTFIEHDVAPLPVVTLDA